jgi:hypothetical protein
MMHPPEATTVRRQQRLERLHRLLRGLELVGLEDLELLEVLWEPVRHAGRQAGAGGDLVDQVVQVQGHRSATGDVAFEDAHQLPVGRPVGLLPRRQRRGAAQNIRGVAVGDLAQARGDRRCQRLEVLGQPVAQLVLDRRGRVDALQDGRRQRVADLHVLEQAIARLHPVLGVEQLPVGPYGDDPERPQKRRKHQQDHYGGAFHAVILFDPG